jgi:hypothetical protein
VIGVTLRTQCEGFAEEGSGGIDVLKMVVNIGFKAGKREVGESCCMIRMADRTLVKNQLKTLHSVVQVRDRLARRVFGKLCVACICVSSNLAVYEGLPLMFRHQKLTAEVSSVTHIKQYAVLILASMYNSGLEREGRVDITNGWEG